MEERQAAIFGVVCSILNEKIADKPAFCVSLETAVPKDRLHSFIRRRKGRRHFYITQADGISKSYRADIMAFPIADTVGGECETHGKTLIIPVLSVRKRYGFCGWEIVANYEWHKDTSSILYPTKRIWLSVALNRRL